MRFYPTKIRLAFTCFIFLSIALILGCSKDSDLLRDAVFEDSTAAVESIEEDSQSEEETQQQATEEETSEESQEGNLDSRTTSFSPRHDAHVQSGKGYNQNIIRLEEGQRTSYLMFDLGPINEIQGKITDITLQITINSDNGSGTINVHKGSSSEWNENDISEATAPKIDVQLGSIIKEYEIGDTEIIQLDTTNIEPELSTLILEHKGGNDLAFASKEHASKIGPKLVVTYQVPEEAEEINVQEEDTDEEDSEEEEEENTSEGDSEEENTTEGNSEEEEDTSEGDSEEENTSEGDSEEENTTEGNSEEEEDTSEGDSEEEETAEEEDTAEEDTPQNTEPMAVADATPSSGQIPFEVTFQGSNSSDDKGITSYTWDFKDGSTASSANPKHTFTKEGIYEVELTVKDAEGLFTTDLVTITANKKKNEAPKAVVSATPITGEAPLEVNFKGSSSTDDNSISRYAWDFKDGSKTNVADFKYTYKKPGTYQAELTVTDENGLSNKASITITVAEPKNVAPVANVSANRTSGTAPLNVQFVGDKSTDDKGISSYAWNFKDGSSATTANPSHRFTSSGTYEVELTVKDASGLENKKTITITVTEPQNNPPIAVATASPLSGQAPLSVQFLGNSSSDDKGITSYLWDFKDGSTASTANPSHSFTNSGVYDVSLTVKDAQGLTSIKQVKITVESASTNAPPGFYVATNGKFSNNGKSPSSPWSLEHAFSVAKAGDIVYVKAGNYGKKELLTRNDGTSGRPVKFIGYKNSPGDIVSEQGSTFSFGETVNGTKMPLLQSSNGTGKAITIHDSYIHIENFQITGYSHGVGVIPRARNVVMKNIIITNVGNQSNQSSYTGFGFTIEGNNALVENCFVQNAGAEAIKLFDSDNSKVNYTKAYSTNFGNPTDYYFLLTGGTDNSVVENSYAERSRGLSHNGHGFTMKDLAEYNTFRNCTVKRTTLELNFSGVKNNTIDNCKVYGVNTSSSSPDAVIAIGNGANNNLIKNTYVQDTWTAIRLFDLDDGYVGQGGDRDLVDLGYNNVFDNITIKNTNRMLNVGGGNKFSASARNYTFKNCKLENFDHVAVTYYRSQNFKFQNCNFENGKKLVVEFGNQYKPYSKFNVSWQNCTWNNVNFVPPN